MVNPYVCIQFAISDDLDNVFALNLILIWILLVKCALFFQFYKNIY